MFISGVVVKIYQTSDMYLDTIFKYSGDTSLRKLDFLNQSYVFNLTWLFQLELESVSSIHGHFLIPR